MQSGSDALTVNALQAVIAESRVRVCRPRSIYLFYLFCSSQSFVSLLVHVSVCVERYDDEHYAMT